MTIHIEALTLDVIIGLLDFERERTQRVIIDMKGSYRYESENFVDYADIVLLIEEELKEKRYELLEEALLGLQNVICTAYPQIKTLSLKITKPDILDKCHVALSQQWTF
ncbi:dihydroneopterin aldolase [Sulfurovum sp.]|uniref:dihydroneopterin aldolase n=1 Tax=Sulfurovum sp. TaxID=1969726 RepID=UPI0025E9AF72|nr:dihydroneopterin aldolase [Sulfurovum sp.]